LRIAACHFPGRSSNAVGIQQRLVELASLLVAHVGERRVADDLLDAAAEPWARHWQSLRWRESVGGSSGVKGGYL